MQRCILLKCTKHTTSSVLEYLSNLMCYLPQEQALRVLFHHGQSLEVLSSGDQISTHILRQLCLCFPPPSVLLVYFFNVVICIFVLLCCFCITTCIFCIFVLSTSDQILTHILRQLCLSSFPIKPFFLTPV